jgi:type IV secretory pathway component VirB8
MFSTEIATHALTMILTHDDKVIQARKERRYARYALTLMVTVAVVLLTVACNL